MTPAGIATIPLHDGKPLPPELFEQLPAVEREQIRQNAEAFGAEAESFLRGMRKVQKEEQEALEALNHEVATFAVGQIIADLLEAYADLPRVLEHLDQIRADLVKHFHDFLPEEVPPGPALAMLEAHQAEDFSRYKANVVVDHSQSTGAPAVFETNPTYYNLLGRTDYRAQFGAMVTDFTMV
jgi:hypothetical protein